MSDVTMDSTVVADSAPLPSYTLRQPRLPRWAPAALAAAAVAVGVGTGLGAGLGSRIQWGLIAAVVFVAGMFALAARVEGLRQAKDRLATSMVWVCFLLAVVPLVSLLWETVSRGAKVLDGNFLSHSMAGVLTIQPGGGV
ncbi:phosphate ABC transporter permease PstA, partial [Streptomyces sp. L500]